MKLDEFFASLEDQNEGLVLKDTSRITHLYHSTSSEEVLKSILTKGLLTSMNSEGMIYLSEKPIVFGGKAASYVLRVKIPDNRELADWREFWYDDGDEKQYDESNPYYIYLKDIPPRYIERVQ